VITQKLPNLPRIRAKEANPKVQTVYQSRAKNPGYPNKEGRTQIQ
jgi:hypothetical protein